MKLWCWLLLLLLSSATCMAASSADTTVLPTLQPLEAGKKWMGEAQQLDSRKRNQLKAGVDTTVQPLKKKLETAQNKLDQMQQLDGKWMDKVQKKLAIAKDTAGLPIAKKLGAANQKAEQIQQIDTKAMDKLNKKYGQLGVDVDKKTLAALNRMEKLEQRMQKKLAAKDSLKAAKIFANPTDRYGKLRNLLAMPNNKLGSTGQYVPGLDSVETATRFMSGKQMPQLTTGKQLESVKGLHQSATALQGKLQVAAVVKSALKEREAQLQQQLAPYKMGKELLGMNKEVYYYQAQLQEYKATLKDYSRMEAKALTYVRELPLFQSFMAKNSQLAGLFRVPDNYGTPQALAGLQTRASVQQLIQTRFGGGGAQSANGGVGDPMGFVRQQLQAAQGQMAEMKNKARQMGGGVLSEGGTKPKFTPNTQKTKTFWKRLTYGFNFQSAKTNVLLPVTTDIAATIGYQLTDGATVGIGLAYKLGWGNGWQQVALSNEGVGLRSFLDVKLKGGIWLTGGYELNYLSSLKEKLTPYRVPTTGWQPSGLIGLTKKYKVGKKTNNMQLLWDFLSYRQIPKGQPIKFRVGF